MEIKSNVLTASNGRFEISSYEEFGIFVVAFNEVGKEDERILELYELYSDAQESVNGYIKFYNMDQIDNIESIVEIVYH